MIRRKTFYWLKRIFYHAMNVRKRLLPNGVWRNTINTILEDILITAHNEVAGKATIVFTDVCDSVHRGGVPDQVHPPGTRYPPRLVLHPPGPAYMLSWTRYTPGDLQVHLRGVWTRIYTPLGPGTLPQDQVHPPGPVYTPPDQVHAPETRYTPPDQVHPPGLRYIPQDQEPPQDSDTPPHLTMFIHPQTRYTPWTMSPRDLVHPPPPPSRTRYYPPDQLHPPWDQVHPPGTRYTPTRPGRYGLTRGRLLHPTGLCMILVSVALAEEALQ